MKGRIAKFIQPKVAAGQIWTEYHCQRNRRVMVLEVVSRIATLQNVDTGRLSRSNTDRFNGEAKGFKYFEIINEKWLEKKKKLIGGDLNEN
jgi:hypothetical protein